MVFANIPACRYPYGMANGSFMENLRQLMAGRGLTISELARKSGVSYQQISYYLTGDPRAKSPAIHNLVKLAKALHCDLEALTGHEELRGVVDMPQLSPEAQALYDYYLSLPEGDTMRTILNAKIKEILNRRGDNGAA